MIGYLALARDTFDINYALDNKKRFEKFIDILDIKYSHFKELITDDETGKKAIRYFKKLNCSKYIIAQTTFTDAKFITSFAKTFNKPIHLISFKEPRTGKRLRLNSLCGVNLAMHSLIKLKYKPEFSIFINNKLFEMEKINNFLKNKKILKNNRLKKIKNSKKKDNIIFSKKKNLGLKNDNKIDTFAIKCWPEMFTQFGCASCGPMAMMNEKGVSSACEADVLGSISCDILNKINNKPSLLVDVVDCDPKTDTLVFWHCGLAPISMAKKNTASATVHSNRRKALLHDFAFRPGKITIFRVSKSENKLKFIVIKGEVLGVVRFQTNTYQKLVRLFTSGIEHHLAFTYGDVYSEIKKLSAQLNIPIYTA